MENLFTTVDKEGEILRTTGTYVIGRSTNKEVVSIYSNSYKDGVAENTGVFQQNDIIYIYPNGYVGGQTKEIGKVLLNDKAIADALQAKENAISSRLTPPKPQ
jgi:hypothetical protein